MRKDLPALVLIYNQAIGAGQTADTVPLTVSERQPWLEAHQDSRYPLFVAVNNGTILGYATLSKYRGGRPALRSVVEVSYYIHRQYQRKGVGKALLAHSLDAARKLEFKHVFALLLDTNLPSIRLLERFDFVQWGHLPNIAEVNEIVCGQFFYGRQLY